MIAKSVSENQDKPAGFHMARMHNIGLHVSPPRVDGSAKTVVGWADFQTTRATDEQVFKWATRYPHNSYGVITGAGSGIVAVDTDSAEAEAWAAKNLPPTPVKQKSGSGRGTHWVYRCPDQEIRNRVKVGGMALDVRGEGGLIVGPGSRHKSGGTYTEFTPWTAELIASAPIFDPSWFGDLWTATKGRERKQYERSELTAEELTRRQQLAGRWLDTKEGATKGDKADNRAFAIAVDLLYGFDLTPDEALPVFVKWGQRDDQRDENGGWYPWSEYELAHKLDDADGLETDGKERGWLFREWERLDFEERLAAGELFRSKVGVEDIGCDLPTEGKPTFLTDDDILTGDDIDREADAEVSHSVVGQVLERGTVNMISGKSYAGKSYLLTAMVGAVLEGGEWLGEICHPHAVLYLNCDRNKLRRVRANIKRGMTDPTAFSRSMYMVKTAALPLTLTAHSLALYAERIAARQRAAGQEPKPLFIIVDTFRSAFLSEAEQGQENDASVMKFIKPIKEWCERTGHCVLIVHHNNKHADDYSGAGAFLMLLDAKMNYQRAADEPIGQLTINTRDDFHETWKVSLDERRIPQRTTGVKEALAVKIYDVVEANPGISLNKIHTEIGGKKEYLCEVRKAMEEAGVISFDRGNHPTKSGRLALQTLRF